MTWKSGHYLSEKEARKPRAWLARGSGRAEEHRQTNSPAATWLGKLEKKCAHKDTRQSGRKDGVN